MENLQHFSKHVPNILRQQALLEISKEYICTKRKNDNSPRRASLQRFYGALLFVDISGDTLDSFIAFSCDFNYSFISGFTVLSQKMDIEGLKNHINDYFTKMLSIVEKWGGG